MMDSTELELRLMPFNCVAALRSCATELQFKSRYTPDKQTKFLWDRFTEQHPEIKNLDHLLPVAQAIWGGADGPPLDLFELLRKSLETLFTTDGGRVFYNTEMAPDLLLDFRSKFAPRLAVCIFSAFNEDCNPTQIQDQHLFPLDRYKDFRNEIQQHKLTETHMHANAALSTEMIWSCTFASKIKPKAAQFIPMNYEEGGPQQDKTLLDWLWLAGITRWLLFEYVKGENNIMFIDNSYRLLKKGIDTTIFPLSADEFFEAWKETLTGSASKFEKMADKLNEDLTTETASEYLEQLYRILVDQSNLFSGYLNPPSVSELLHQERDLIITSLQRIYFCADQRQPEYDGAVLQYIRMRNLFHRHFVLPGKGRGLRKFKDYYDRGRRYAAHICDSYKIQAFSQSLAQLDPHYLINNCEIRMSTHNYDKRDKIKKPYDKSHIARILYSIQGMEDVVEEKEKRNVGLVFHFKKEDQSTKENNNGKEIEKPIDPVEDFKSRLFNQSETAGIGPSTRWREAERYNILLEEAKALYDCWDKIPILSHYFVGLDVACYEEDEPNWLFVAVLRWLKNKFNNQPIGNDRQVPKFTFHAGEQFSLVSSGLRRIYEVIDLVGIDGRIGHALALVPGVEPTNRNKITNEEWGMNLCWAHKHLRNTDYYTQALKSQIEDWITAICQLNWGSIIPPNIELMAQVYGMLTRPDELDKILYANDDIQKAKQQTEKVDKIYKYLFHILTHPDYKQWAGEKITVPELPTECLQQLRKITAKEIEDRGITIESCPTSNLKILGLNDYQSHPAVEGFQELGHNIKVSINTDDPLQFSTDLLMEFLLTYRAKLKQKGIDSQAARAWLIDRLEQNARSCFIENPENRPSWEEINRELDRILMEPD